MAESNDYLLVKADVLPEVFVKVMEAKRLLNSGKAVSVNEAVRLFLRVLKPLEGVPHGEQG